MAPSQLRQLKASLRESGVVGQQKSKKQKRQASKGGGLKESRIQRNAALQSIREQFNPFEVRPAGHSKHAVTSNANLGTRAGQGTTARPGVSKGLGEKNRRETLLVEMQRRKKVGGIMDRRFGENDATMTPEEKTLQRYIMERQRGTQKGALFDLEDSEEEGDLTHSGKALSFAPNGKVDDFNEAGLESSDSEDVNESNDDDRPHKRRKLFDTGIVDNEIVDAEDDEIAAKPKTKNEVMKELISKSKLHKYERQQAKEDDDDLRAELDKGLPELFALLRKAPASASAPKNDVKATVPAPNGVMNPDRMALLNGKDRSQADKEYDQRLRQMAMDQRAKPTQPTLTDEEKAATEAQRLMDLERRRLRRMRGDQGDSGSEISDREVERRDDLDDDEQDTDAFGLGLGLGADPAGKELGVEDEDEFVLDNDLVADESMDDLSSQEASEPSDEELGGISEDEAEFVQGILSTEDAGRADLSISGANTIPQANGPKTGLAFTYACPQTHGELLQITKEISFSDLPTVVQRIRALYQPKLANDNKAKLGVFATVLVEHIAYLTNLSDHPSFEVLESLIRHVHSLAKTFSEEVGRAFRSHLKAIHETRPAAPTPGDLVIFTAIGSIFPTSDHFHQVVTPTMLCMTRYLGQKIPSTLPDLAMGTYISSLCLNYQKLSKRYVPEVVNYTLNAIYALISCRSKHSVEAFPRHDFPASLQMRVMDDPLEYEKSYITFWDTSSLIETDLSNNGEALKHVLLSTHIRLTEIMADLWAEKSAFCEILGPIEAALSSLSTTDVAGILSSQLQTQARRTSQKIRKLLDQSLQARQPLRLHSHRPLAIKSAIPKFEESYNPDKHYDPDRDRAELSKLKAEHKKERKGALRELRKDANFMARESLKEKKERDSAYEKKYKRLVAEIQGEEGREAKLYEREKKMRKGRK